MHERTHAHTHTRTHGPRGVKRAATHGIAIADMLDAFEVGDAAADNTMPPSAAILLHVVCST